MANIKSDNQGFLIGEPLDLNRTFELWSDIRNDMRAIRLALNGKGVSGFSTGRQMSGNRKIDNERVPQQPVATPQRRNENGRESPSATASTQKAVMAALKPTATPSRASARVNQSARDDKTGRFTKGGNNNSSLFGNESAGSNDRYVSSSPSGDSSMRMAAEKIANAVSSAGSGMEETDPAIKAFSEVAQPMARGYEMLTAGTGREQKDTFRWFRKIFGELKLFRKDETAFNKAANKSLKNIEENPAGGASPSGGDSSWLRRYILPAVIAGLGALAASLPSGFMDKLAVAHRKSISAIKDTLFTSPLNHIVKNWDSIQAQMSSILEGVSSRIDSAWGGVNSFV